MEAKLFCELDLFEIAGVRFLAERADGHSHGFNPLDETAGVTAF
jgi:hypothetical protein